jgi:uncharacterized short protein YbdD (DUF466 family)
MHRPAELIARTASFLRRVIGAPDYERYVKHVQAAHPGTTLMSREQYTQDALARRYGRGAGRCC